jgi:uncharacterized protein YbjT (DUF2867 family)
MARTYTIAGATGNIGKATVEALLAEGHAVRVIGRDQNRLRPLTERGAEGVAGDLTDAAFLTEAYRGADGVLAMVPPNLQTNDYRAFADSVANAHVAAIRDAKIGHVVALSSIGAHRDEGTGIVLSLHDFEQHLAVLHDTSILNLRPAYFMENIYPQIEVIKMLGVMGSPVAADVSQPVVATRDVGAVAAARLAGLGFEGHSVEYVLGERDLSYGEITAVIGRAIGKEDLQYVQFPYEDSVRAFQQLGVSENVARLVCELAEGINNGKVLEHYERTTANTTPTTIEQFAEGFAQAYRQP